jgi:hypothetical protein
MANIFGDDRTPQNLAPGRLGWPLAASNRQPASVA